MFKKFKKIRLSLFSVVVDAGGVNRSPSGSGYVVNAYTNTIATSGNDFTPQQAKFYARAFLKNYQGKLVHGQFGIKESFPKHNGNIINIRGMSPYPTVTTPLTEGVTPAGNLMSFYYVEIPVYQYGSYTPITDFARFASRDQVQLHDSEELSSQAGRTIEEIDAAALNGGQSVIYAPAVASNGMVTEVAARTGLNNLCKFSVDVVFRALNYLEVQDAPPIGDSYVAIIHPNVKYDVMRDPGFIDVVKYAQSTRIMNGEIGMVGNIRFVVSTFAKVFANSGARKDPSSQSNLSKYDVYSTLVLGKDAYETVEIEGEGMQVIIKPLGSAGSADPLNQRATQGWKTTHGIGIICETNMVRVESTATLNTAKASNETYLRARYA